MSICADERLCKGTTSYCPGSYHVGFEGEGADEVGKPAFFFSFLDVCVFSPPKKRKPNQKNPPTKVRSTPIVFLTINRQNLFGLKSQAVPGQDPTTTAQYVGGSHIHTSYLSPPVSLAARTMFQFVKPLLGRSRGNPRHCTDCPRAAC